MPSTINSQTTETNPVSKIAEYKRTAGTGLEYVVRGIRFTTDIAADDTTVFTVPAGKTFLCTRIMSNVSGNHIDFLTVYDNVGNSATGQTPIAIFVADQWYGMTTYDLSETPVVFEKGITLKGSEMENSESYQMAFFGYYV